MQRGPGLRGGSARGMSAVRLAVGLAGLLAAMLVAGTAEAAPVPRGPQHARTSARAVVAEPKMVRSKAAASRGAASKATNARTSAKAGRGRSEHAKAEPAGIVARGKGRVAPGRAASGRASARDTKESVKGGRPKLQARRRRGRRLDEVDTPPVTMYRAKVEKTEAKPADGEVAGQKTLTVDDFEKAASGAVAAPAETAEKTDAVKPLTKSAVRAANEKAEAEKAAARAANERAAAERVAEQKAAADRVAEAKIAEADRLAARPSGQRLPMGGYAAGGGTDGTLYGAKRSVVIVRPPVKTTAAAPVKAAVVGKSLPQVQANGPTAAVVATATALPRLEASGDVSDAAVASDGEADADGTVGSESARQTALVRDTENDDVAPAKRSLRMSEATHEEMAAAAVQPMVLPGLYRDGRLMVPAPLRGTREILVHQNTMADDEGLERIRNESDLNRLRAAHELVNLQESVSLRVNPELGANRRCARVWSVRFAEDMARAFYARFHEPLQVNSAVRTVAFQVRLRRVNGNAAATGGDGASPHLTGQALDFGKRGMSVEEIAWMRLYLLPLMQAGKVDVEEEFQQACFHISVYRSYLQNPPTRHKATRNELAQLRSEARSGKSLPPSDEENDQE